MWVTYRYMPTRTPEQLKFLHATPRPWRFNPWKLLNLSEHERLRRVARLIHLSRAAQQKLEWIIWYAEHDQDALLTSRHFGISPKTLYKWLKRFDPLNLRSLEEQSRAPKRHRQKEFTPLQYERVVRLRRQFIRYGKEKLLRKYQEAYPKDIAVSSWKVQCIIQASGIYYQPKKQARINKKRVRSVKRKKITDLKQQPRSGFLLCLDTVVQYLPGAKRYILTAIDRHAKVAYARMYQSHSSKSAADFLLRLNWLLDGRIENIQTDNGSEFQKYFTHTASSLNLTHYFSRVRTPKDNAVNERFNRTLQDEFIQLGNLTSDTEAFNRRLTEWLVEYNFKRPHQTLGYMPPMNFLYKHHRVLPMCPSSTHS